jgi:hypothetical protein
VKPRQVGTAATLEVTINGLSDDLLYGPSLEPKTGGEAVARLLLDRQELLDPVTQHDRGSHFLPIEITADSSVTLDTLIALLDFARDREMCIEIAVVVFQDISGMPGSMIFQQHYCSLACQDAAALDTPTPLAVPNTTTTIADQGAPLSVMIDKNSTYSDVAGQVQEFYSGRRYALVLRVNAD